SLQPVSLSVLNISAMSFGALSGNAVLALNKGAALGAKAHGGNIEHRQRHRLPALRTANGNAEVAILDYRRLHGMVDPFVIGAIDISLGTKRTRIHGLLGALVDQRTVGPRER